MSTYLENKKKKPLRIWILIPPNDMLGIKKNRYSCIIWLLLSDFVLLFELYLTSRLRLKVTGGNNGTLQQQEAGRTCFDAVLSSLISSAHFPRLYISVSQ